MYSRCTRIDLSRLTNIYVVEGLNKAKQDCSQGMSSIASLTKAYAGLVTFNLEVTEIQRPIIRRLVH